MSDVSERAAAEKPRPTKYGKTPGEIASLKQHGLWTAEDDGPFEPELEEWWKRIDDFNSECATLAKNRKLTTEKVFGKNYLSDAVMAAMADYFKKEMGRDCRKADGTIDFFHDDHRDCWWGYPESVVDALFPILLEMYEYQYGGSVEGALDWLGQKVVLMTRKMEAGTYHEVAGCMSDGSCLGSRDFAVIVAPDAAHG